MTSRILGEDEVEESSSRKIPPEDAAPVLAKVKRARELNGKTKADLDVVCTKMKSGKPLSPEETSRVLILLAQNEQAHTFRKAMMSGEAYSRNPSAKLIQKHVVVGAVKAMTPTEQGMLAQVMSMAKSGNRNAVKALRGLRAQGYAATMGQAGLSARVPGVPLSAAEQQKLAAVVTLARQGNANAQAAVAKLIQQGYTVSMGSFVGWGIEDAFKLALKPVTIPLQYAWKGTKAAAQWTGRQLGITHGGTSPEQARLQRLKAAQARIRAAKARAQAADAQSEAEYRTQQQLASAADAEADAADAEATAKEAAMETAEAQYLPGQTDEEAEAANAAVDASGRRLSSSAMGAAAYSNFGVKPTVTPLPATPAPKSPAQSAKDAELDKLMKASYNSRKQLKAARRTLVAKHDPKAAKILAVSAEKTPAGMKLKAAMKLYVAAEKRGSKERLAVAVMAAKAKKGDKQALADVQALKLAGIAVKAERKAAKQVERIAKRRARAAKLVALRKKAEVAASNELIRVSRARKLAKVAKLEKKAAAGNPKARAFIAKHEALAKKGNKQSAEVVKAVALVKNVRTMAPNSREKKNLRAAHRLVKRVEHGNKKALRETRVIVAAAKHGNPNAKRARKRLQTAAAVELTLKTGTVVVPAAALTGAMVAERKKKEAAKDKKKLASVEAKIANKTASREEVVAAARTASEQGDRAKAAELLTEAAVTPSAGDELRRVATVAAAAEAGNPRTQANLQRAETLAAEGDPRGIEAMGKLAAVKNLSQVSKGRDLDPEMKEAVADVEAASAGSVPVAEKIASMQEKAAARDPAAVKYMVAATGAAIVSRALASNPKAQEEWKEKAGVVPGPTENEDVAVGPPLLPGLASSLPDLPLPPIRSFLGLLKASARALTLATRDPFQNYREGVRSRSTESSNVSTAGAAAPTTRAEGSSLDAREVKVLEDALKSKTITQADFEQLRKKEKSPGSALASLKNAGISVVSFGPASASGGLTEIVGTVIDPTEFLGDDSKYAVHAKPEEDADWQKLVTQTRQRLGAVKAAADKGDADAKKKWATAQANFVKNAAKAKQGDDRARTVFAVLAATGLFKQ